MNKNNKIEIKDLFRKIFKDMYEYYYEKEYIETISNLPLRSVIQYLKAYKNYVDNTKQINDRVRKAFIQSNKDIFLNSLIKYGLDHEFFDLAVSKKGIDLLASKIFHKLSFEELREFKPHSSDQHKNILLLIIPQFFHIYYDFSQYIDWGIKLILPKYISESDLKINSNDIDNFIQTYSSYSDKIHYLLNYLKDIFLAVPTYRHQERAKDSSSIKQIGKYIIENYEYIYFYTPQIYISPTKGEEYTYFSALDVIYFLFKILYKLNAETTNSYKDADQEELYDFIYKKISQFSQLELERNTTINDSEKMQVNDIAKNDLEKIKIKISDIARILGMENEELLKKLQDLGIEAKHPNKQVEIKQIEPILEEIDMPIEEFKRKVKILMQKERSLDEMIEELNELVSIWEEKIYEYKKYLPHLLKFNKAFANYIKHMHFLKEKLDKGELDIPNISTYFKFAIFNFLNELILVELEDNKIPAKRIQTSLQKFWDNLGNLELTNKKFYELIKLLIVSPIFLPYYATEILEELENQRYKQSLKKDIYNLIQNLYEDNGWLEKFKSMSEKFSKLKVTK